VKTFDRWMRIFTAGTIVTCHDKHNEGRNLHRGAIELSARLRHLIRCGAERRRHPSPFVLLPGVPVRPSCAAHSEMVHPHMIEIASLNADDARQALPGLVQLLQDAVGSGASLGFLPPLDEEVARAYWRDVIGEVASGKRVLLVATADGEVVGSAQLELAAKPNARHRAEVQRLMVHTRMRGRGIGRALMSEIERAAREQSRSLLVLDTRKGDVAERLYLALGYVPAGVIPAYTRDADGTPHDTIYFYRAI